MLRALADVSGEPITWMLAHAPLGDKPETEEERNAVAEASRGTGRRGSSAYRERSAPAVEFTPWA